MADVPRLRAPAPAPVRASGPVPRVSVLIPAYNAADTVGEALESALAQRPAPFDVVVSDDGSVDDLDAALRPFRAHIRVVRGPNGGLAVARNRAAAAARGDLLALLDADDVWLPGRVEALRDAAAARPDLSILTTDAVVVRAGRAEPDTYYATRRFDVDDQASAILDRNFVFGAGAVRSAAFHAAGGYRAAARYAEDWDLWLRLLLGGHRAGLVDEPLYEYRRREDSLTAHRVDLALGVLTALRRARPLVRTREHHRALARTEQRWREAGARAAAVSSDPRRRRLAARAAVGARARSRTRLRFALAALAPQRVLDARLGGHGAPPAAGPGGLATGRGEGAP